MIRTPLLLVTLLATLAQPLLGQRSSSAIVAETVLRQGPGVSDVLRQRVTLELGAVPLVEALDRATRAASGASLTYSPELVPDVTVEVAVEDVALGEVYRRLLSGTGLEVVEASSGRLVLVQRDDRMVGMIVGRVLDAGSNRPVPGVSVAVEGTELGALSGDDGRYSIRAVPAGRHTLEAVSVGYRALRRSVEVEDGGTAVADLRLEPSAVGLDEMVVTGTLTPTPIRAVPSPITVIRAAEIERHNIESVDEILRLMVPGAATSDDNPGLGGYTRYSVRGTSSLVSPSSMKVYVDGVELQSAAYINNINPDIIERVEVTSGPQASTVYGSGAISGVVQIFTKKGLPGAGRPTVSGRVAFGTIDDRYVDDTPTSRDFAVDVLGGGESFGYQIAATWQEEGAWVPHSDANAGSVSATGNFTQERFRANFGLRYRVDQGKPGVDPQSLAIGFENENAPPPTNEYDFRDAQFGLTLDFDATPWWSHDLALGMGLQESDNYTDGPRLSFPGDTLNQVSTSRGTKANIRYHTTVELPTSGDLGARLTVGADHTRSGSSSFSGGEALYTRGSFNDVVGIRGVTHRGGFFGQAQLDLRDELYLTVGLHGDRSEFTPGTEWSPRVGASWVRSLGDVQLKLRGAWGQAIVSPTQSQVERILRRTVLTLANPDLRPEKQKGWDGGVELYFGDRASLSLTYYDQTAFDLISRINLGRNPETELFEVQWQNLGKVQNRGFEASANVALTEDLRVTGVFGSSKSTAETLAEGYTGDLEEGQDMLGVPDWTAAATVTWSPIPGTRLAGSLSHRASWTEVRWVDFYGEIFSGNFFVTTKDFWDDYPSWTKYNLSVSQDVGDHFTGFVQVNNVGNDYAFEWLDFVSTRGREMKLGFRFRTD